VPKHPRVISFSTFTSTYHRGELKHPATKKPAKALANQVIDHAFQNGLIMLPCGQSVVRLAPPLMIDAALIEEAMVALDQTFNDVERSMN
jgi:4-aminobutyrate aminotransferase-like enzyme